MKDVTKLAKAVGLFIFSYVAVICSIVPFLTIGYTPDAAVVISCIIVFLGMSRVGMIQKRKAANIWADIKQKRVTASATAHSFAI